jgi:hypothetical protein
LPGKPDDSNRASPEALDRRVKIVDAAGLDHINYLGADVAAAATTLVVTMCGESNLPRKEVPS